MPLGLTTPIIINKNINLNTSFTKRQFNIISTTYDSGFDADLNIIDILKQPITLRRNLRNCA